VTSGTLRSSPAARNGLLVLAALLMCALAYAGLARMDLRALRMQVDELKSVAADRNGVIDMQKEALDLFQKKMAALTEHVNAMQKRVNELELQRINRK